MVLMTQGYFQALISTVEQTLILEAGEEIHCFFSFLQVNVVKTVGFHSLSHVILQKANGARVH